jgi:hypothetical protein
LVATIRVPAEAAKNTKNVAEDKPMPVIYKNCFDEEYFLHEGKTKTGKPKYFFSKKKDGGDLVEVIPSGYEIYERPGGMVYLRKIQKTLILKGELEYVQNMIAGKIVDEESEKHAVQLRKMLGNGVLGFLGGNPDRISKYLRNQFEAEIKKDEIIIYEVRASNAMPLLKFVLIDESKRLFSVYRWCFRGSIDDWVHIGYHDNLKKLADQYCPALGTERFYELR